MQAGFLAESLFRVFDEDNSGALSFYEFAQVLFNTNMTKTMIPHIFGRLNPITCGQPFIEGKQCERP